MPGGHARPMSGLGGKLAPLRLPTLVRVQGASLLAVGLHSRLDRRLSREMEGVHPLEYVDAMVACEMEDMCGCDGGL